MAKTKSRPKKSRPSAEPDAAAKSPVLAGSPDRLWGIPRNRIPHLIIFVLIAFGGSYAWIWFTNSMGITKLTHEVIREHPHDPNAFTQGLIYEDGFLYESTGQFGQSELRKVELKNRKSRSASCFG